MNLQELQTLMNKDKYIESKTLEWSGKTITGNEHFQDELKNTLTEVWEAAQEVKTSQHGLTEREKAEYEDGYEAALDAVDSILLDELALAHTTKSGKTSRLTSAINRITKLRNKE